MNPTGPQLLVAALDRLAVVKISGRANFTLGPDFKRVIASLRERGYKRFALELSQCQLMDSTFLGVVAGFALKQAEPTQSDGSPITLIAPQPRVLDLLDNLGVKQLFQVVDNSAPAPENYQAVEPTVTPKAEVSRTCLEAHELLMAINPANVAKFKDVCAFFAEDLKRLEQKG